MTSVSRLWTRRGPTWRAADGWRGRPLPGGGCLPVRVGLPALRSFVLTELDGGVCLEEVVGGLADVAGELAVLAAYRRSSRRWLTACCPEEAMPELLRVEVIGAGKRPARERARQEVGPA